MPSFQITLYPFLQFGDYCLTIGLVALILGIVMVACTGELINPCKRHKPALPAVEPQPAGASTAAAAAPADASSRAWDAMEPATSAKRIEDEAAALGVPAAFLAQVRSASSGDVCWVGGE